jgi:PAS domain S-box-containing protein
MVLKKEIALQIKDLLKENPQGLSITDIVKVVNINRNTAGRYLENLLVSGQVEMRRLGMAKIYMLSQRVPLSAVLSISSELVMQLDSSLRIIFANEPFLNLIGIDAKSLFGRNIEYTPVATLFDDLFPGFLENIREGLTGKEWAGDILLTTKDLIFFCRIAPTVFDDGRKGVSVLLEDITEQKRAKEALQKSEEQYRSLFFGVSEGILVADMQTQRFLHANPALCRLLGYSEQELVTKYVADIHPKDNLDYVLDEFAALACGNKTRVKDIPLLRKDGTIVYADLSASGVFIDDRLCNVGFFTDTTERKKSELIRIESENRYRTIFENTGTATVQIEKNTVISLVNVEFEHLSGFSRHEIEGKKSWTEFVVKEDLERMLNQHRMRMEGQERSLKNYEFRFITKSGDIRTIFLTIDMIPGTKNSVASLLDITERKCAENSLRESEDRYRKLVEISPDAVFLHREGKIIYANPAAFKLVGASHSDEIIGKSILDFIHPEFRDAVRKNIEKDRGGDITPPMELHMLRVDGTSIIVEGRGVKTNIDGKPAVQVAIRDITERKHAEEALRESEGKLNAMLQSIADPMSMMDKDLTIMWAYEPAKRYFGKDIIGKKCYEVYHLRPDPCEPYPCLTLKAFLDGKTHQHETTVIDNQGEKRFFECMANVALRDNSGKPVAVLETSRDITNRKKAEDALRESEERLRFILDSTDDLIIMQNPEGRYLYFNSATRYGVSVEETLGSTPYDFIDRESDDRLMERLKKVATTGQSIKDETPLVWKGQTLWFSDSLSPVRDVNGTITAVVTISQNITEQKRAEMALRESEATARALIDALTDSVILVDTQGIILALNDTAALRFGRRADELIGVLADDLLPEEIARSRRSLVAQVLEKKKMVRFEDERDGSWYDTVAYPIVSDTGEVNRIAIIARDITDRRNTEEGLIHSEQRFRNLITAIGDIVWETDAHARFVYVSPQVETILGYKPDELIGHTPFEFLHPDAIDPNQKKFQTVVERHEKSVLHVSHWIHKDGHEVHLESNAIPIYDSTGSFSGFIGIDRKR